MGQLPHLDDMMVLYGAYLVAVASPGPSNLLIMSTAMRRGRVPAIIVAAGIMTGSLFWAILAGAGVSAILTAYAGTLTVLKLAGGLYLLFLAWKAARSAMIASMPTTEPDDLGVTDVGRLYRRGLLMHLTNPKAILAWLAIMSLGLRADVSPWTPVVIILGCAVIGVIVFGGYAVVFFHPPMVRLYGHARRRIEAFLAAFFAYAGIRLLTSSV